MKAESTKRSNSTTTNGLHSRKSSSSTIDMPMSSSSLIKSWHPRTSSLTTNTSASKSDDGVEIALENARSTIIQHSNNVVQREAALVARASVAEEQLATTHDALQDAQRAHRDSVAVAAELQERAKNLQNERDTVLQKLESAASLLKESCSKAETLASERDAARKEALQARATANIAETRLREVEALQEIYKKKGSELLEQRSVVETESLRLRDVARSVERRETELKLKEELLQSKEQSLEKRERHVAEQMSVLQEKESTLHEAMVSIEREHAEVDARIREMEQRHAVLLQEEESIKIARRLLVEEKDAMALARDEADRTLRKKAEAEIVAKNAYERASYEDHRRQQAESRCVEERIALKKLQDEHDMLLKKVGDLRSAAAQEEICARKRLEELSKAQQEASQSQQDVEESLKTLRTEQQRIDETTKSLKLQEKQAKDAATAARKEQVVLACARRDSARTVSEMQQRHIEAAVKLEDYCFTMFSSAPTTAATSTQQDFLPLLQNEQSLSHASSTTEHLVDVESSLHRWRAMAGVLTEEPSFHLSCNAAKSDGDASSSTHNGSTSRSDVKLLRPGQSS